MATRVPALIQLGDPRVAAQLVNTIIPGTDPVRVGDWLHDLEFCSCVAIWLYIMCRR